MNKVRPLRIKNNMAIASGLTCVNYLASNFYSPTYLENEFRYSPTLAYDNDLFTNYVSQKHQDQRTNVFDEPLLEFTRLSLAEKTFDFTAPSTIDSNKQRYSSCYNDEFITEFEKMKNVLSIKRTLTNAENKVNPFSVNNEPCQKCILTKEVVEAHRVLTKDDTTNSFSDTEEDEELDAVFTQSKYSRRVLKGNANRFKSNSLSHFKRHMEKEKEESEASDSEIELTQIITPETPPPQHQRRLFKSCITSIISMSSTSRKRRTSPDSSPHHSSSHPTSPSGDQYLLSASLTKRPCIDVEKMHRSMVLRSSRPSLLRKVRRNLDKELFVPIDQ